LGAKVLRTESHVQLIVFFAAIREILKREIYGRDKGNFWLVKTKGYAGVIEGSLDESRMRAIRFVNAENKN